MLELRTGFLHPHEHAGQPHPGQTARALERQQDDFGDLRRTMLLGPAPEVTAADQSGFVVVGAEVGRAGMRHFDRNERDVRFPVLGGDDRGDVLVGLELDDEVHFLAHQDIGVALRDLGAVAVVDANELDTLGGGGPLHAGRDLLGELVVGALRGVAKPIGALLEGTQVRAIQVLAHFFNHPAALEGVQQPERHAFRQAASRRHFPERQRLAGRAECG